MAFPTASLRHRYEAKDESIYTDGNTLTQVTDQSGNLRHLNVVTGTPTWESLELNGHAVYRFDGTESVALNRASPDLTAAAAISVMVVAKANVEGSTRTWVFGVYDSTTDIMALTEGNTAGEWALFARTSGAGGGTATQLATSGADTTEWGYLLLVWGGATLSLYFNGEFVASENRPGTFNLEDVEMADVTGTPFGGDIAAAATWAKALDATERGDLDDYIATTYGVGLPSFPAAPANLTATAVSATQVDLSWDAVSGATGYDIRRGGTVIVTGQVGTTYSDTSPDGSTLYEVRAVG